MITNTCRIFADDAKTKRTKNETTIPRLYMKLIRPLLKYTNVVWGPHYKGDQQMLEKLQKEPPK